MARCVLEAIGRRCRDRRRHGVDEAMSAAVDSGLSPGKAFLFQRPNVSFPTAGQGYRPGGKEIFEIG